MSTSAGATARRPACQSLRKRGHEAAIDLRAVPGVGAEIVLSVDGEWRQTRLFRAHEQAELSGATVDTLRGEGMDGTMTMAILSTGETFDAQLVADERGVRSRRG